MTEPGGAELVRIGTFSHIGRVSARLLRHYHAIGLLTPATVDGNGYRLYDVAQLGDLHRILALRDLGMSLEQVRDAIDWGLDTDELRRLLERLEIETERERDRADTRLRSIRARVRAIDDPRGDEPLTLRRLEETPFRSVSGTYTPAEARAVVLALFDHGRHLDVEPPFVAARWLGPYEASAWPLEIGLVGVPPVEDEPVELTDSVLPAGAFVSTVRTMAADDAHELYAAVPTYCTAHELQLDGRLRELVYAMPPAGGAGEPTVEVQFGVTSTGRSDGHPAEA
ncbi:MAG: MerR family transcriptional regulator [Actinomycetota bacterium]